MLLFPLVKGLQKNQMLISQKILLIQLINFQKILWSFEFAATIYEGYKNTTQAKLRVST